jgi:hypothetical protein
LFCWVIETQIHCRVSSNGTLIPNWI